VTFFRQFYLAFHTPTCGGYHANSWRAKIFERACTADCGGNTPPCAADFSLWGEHTALYRRLASGGNTPPRTADFSLRGERAVLYRRLQSARETRCLVPQTCVWGERTASYRRLQSARETRCLVPQTCVCEGNTPPRTADFSLRGERAVLYRRL